ncbi:Secondary metabolism regulator LAE1 [Colletotrichum siamense]|uniref:Secondary metabolism regulator LAE1 n=1 Tax=Colletotrichum siamense TaxID=690259 RepID=A0A9P5EU42_COLSI|nr:Secondary metabolism regulator LAE1 [Colletotrichum siamense]KAF4811473.1 Secondary metabolism regulator LAE1 [Colletotrichum siamense]KAF4859348.1 Secondary metabolism regulator LAE1 [Colletotrichum siamense]KAF4875146.1 Secondary metabolism regulator LAE1 [Colletotrichum siamense]KAF5510888.1 Secondary metabolism regulator LAE1 [Colletotrichum siamense]
MASPPNDFEIQVAADEQQDDSHSDIESVTASSTTSLRESVVDYLVENGRTYHRYKEGNMVHALWLLTLDDKLGLAPPCDKDAKVGRVLDIGTGTGIWAINFADEHPESEVLGNDLSPIQPSDVPPNVRFEVDDIEDEWTYSRPFDYIHSRVMTSSVADWPQYLKKCYDNLQPGGYLELQELDLFPSCDDGTLTKDSPLMKWADLLYGASVKFGRPYLEISTLRKAMIEAGFEDVTMSTYKWPSNSWPRDVHFKELGMWQRENMLSGLDGFTLAPLTRAHDWSPAEVSVFLIDVRKVINDRNIHAYWPIYFIVGRKPLKEEK